MPHDPYHHESPAGTLWATTTAQDKPPAKAHHNGTHTSRDAAEAIEPHVTELQRRVHDFVHAKGLMGATREEISVGLPMKIQTVCPRVSEMLKPDMNVLIEPGKRRDGAAVLVSMRVFLKAFPPKG